MGETCGYCMRVKTGRSDWHGPRPTRRHLLLGALLLPGLAACSAGSSSLASPTGTSAGRTPPSSGGPSPNTPSAPSQAATPSSSTGGVLNIVAHQDDDLLFLSPALLLSLRSGAPVRTMYLTAGDDGRPTPYWRGRESGIRAAYATMLGAANVWHPAPPTAPAPVRVLAAAPQVSLQFLRLPDGGPGHGFPLHQNQSLPQLWRGQQAVIHAVDGSARYTRASLIQALVTVMDEIQPNIVRTQDFHGRFNDGDHNDHHAAAFLTQAASRLARHPHWLEAYQDYSISARPDDVPGAQLRGKERAFDAYAAHDRLVCTKHVPSCAFSQWQPRQYRESRTWSA
jgi:LmbE family N-acetylglucosaminyl deacetylase